MSIEGNSLLYKQTNLTNLSLHKKILDADARKLSLSWLVQRAPLSKFTTLLKNIEDHEVNNFKFLINNCEWQHYTPEYCEDKLLQVNQELFYLIGLFYFDSEERSSRVTAFQEALLGSGGLADRKLVFLGGIMLSNRLGVISKV